MPKTETKSVNLDENQCFLIIFRHKKWRKRKIRDWKGHIFTKRNFSVRLNKSAT